MPACRMPVCLSFRLAAYMPICFRVCPSGRLPFKNVYRVERKGGCDGTGAAFGGWNHDGLRLAAFVLTLAAWGIFTTVSVGAGHRDIEVNGVVV